MQARIIKKGKDTEKLLRSFANLASKSLRVGHFEADGKHYSGMSYPDLMELHHTGTGTGSGEIPPRPILDLLSYRIFNTRGIRDLVVKREINKLLKNPEKISLLNVVGEQIVKIEKSLFGSGGPLLANSPYTIALKGRDDPLVDSGTLRDKVRYEVGRR